MMSRWLSMDMLNDEALTLILIRLHSTHLHRYKCVSKRWCAIISDQYFVRRYIEFNKNSTQHDHFMIHSNPLSQFVLPDHPQLLQHYESVQNVADFSLKFLPIPRESIYSRDLNILGASHGLLLCKFVSKFYVCNPLTRQYLEVPRLPGQVPTHVGFTCYPVDPTSSEVEFIVLVVVGNKIPSAGINSFRTHVFRSKTGKWDSFDVAFPPGIGRLSFDTGPTVFCNGYFHWCPLSPPVSIISYDPINQPNVCRFMQIPPMLLPSFYFWHVDHIGVTEGRIRIIIRRKSKSWCEGEDKTKFFNVYEVVDNDKGIFDWKYQVEQPRNFAVTSRFLSRMHGEMVYFVNCSTKKLMLFNMNDGSQQSTLSLSSICKKRDNHDKVMPFTMTPWPTPIPKLPLWPSPIPKLPRRPTPIPKLPLPQKDEDVKE